MSQFAASRARTALTPWLVEFDQVGQFDPDLGPSLVGSKAYNLARLSDGNHLIPEGFCITTEAFQRCCLDNDTIELDPEFINALTAQFQKLLQRFPDSQFAVRSSAPEEDGDRASWAGIFHSSLNIRDVGGLIEAVERGFSSLFSQQACLYRQQQARFQPVQQAMQPTMALLVQRQIEASSSGILFSQDPMTRMESRHPRRCINAIRGLGEALASGERNGDLFWIDQNNRLLEHRLEPLAAGASAQPPVLNRQQLRQLGQLATRLERNLGAPQDIEFCYQGSTLWLLQARPIVPSKRQLAKQAQEILKQEQRRLNQRLKQMQQQQQLKHGPGVLSNSNIAELLPSPTPMSFAVFNQVFAGPNGAIPLGRQTLGYQLAPTDTKHLFELIAGQPYFHLEIDANSYQHGQPLPIDDYLDRVKATPSLANYPEFGLYGQFNQLEALQQQFGQTEGQQRFDDERQFHHKMTEHGRHFIRQYRLWIDSYLEQYVTEQQTADLNQMNAPQLIIQIHNWLSHLRDISCCHFVIAARLGFYFAESLRFEFTQLLGERAEPLLAQLLQALPGSRINQQCFDLQAVAKGQLSETEYLDRYGHLAANELELSLPRYRELTEPVKTLLAANQSTDTLAEFNKQHRQRKKAERDLSGLFDNAGLDSAKRQQIWSDLRLAQRFLPLRETVKYHYTGEYALIREALLQLEQRLRLGQGQIFYLQPDELSQCLKSLPCSRRLIQQRQQHHHWIKQIAEQQPLPAVIFGDRVDLSSPPPGASTGGDGADKHNGQPLAPGFIRGRVRLIDPGQVDLTQLMSSVDERDIIVSRSANLGLAPLMRKVAGLIVEVGGFLSHAACQAREAGIPAMTLSNATELLREGAIIEIDGNAGVVRIGS